MVVAWFVSCTTDRIEAREELYAIIKKQLIKDRTCADLGVFDVPLDLRFSSFDDLLKSADDLEKEDQMVENALRRAQQLALDIDPNIEFKVNYHGRELSLNNYITRFTWDDAKFPKYIPLDQNLKTLSSLVQKLLEDITLRASVYSELRHKKMQMNTNMDSSTLYRDLVYVITPEVIEDETDFPETEHLTTVVAYVPLGSEDEWLKSYMKFASNILPNCAKKLNVSCKSYTLWRVVMFKSSVNTFIENCKIHNFNAQQFTYSKDKYQQLLEKQSKLEADAQRQQTLLSRIYNIAYSDLFSYWIHLKAMRVFCESVLKFGLPVRFACFYILPKDVTTYDQIHRVLQDKLPRPEVNTNDDAAGDDMNLPYLQFNINVGS